MPDLPSVEQRFIADMIEYLAALDDGIGKAQEFAAANKAAEDAVTALALAADEAAAVIDAAMGTATRAVHDVRDAFLGAAAAAQGLKGAGSDTGLGGAATQAGLLHRELTDINLGLMGVNAQLVEAVAYLKLMQGDMRDMMFDTMGQIPLLQEIRDLLLQSAAAAKIYNSTIRDGNAATRAAAGGFRMFLGGIRLTGNALHWLVGIGIEVLAVAIPAAIAAGVAGFVMYQAVVESVGLHMQALYTATEATSAMFGKTVGNILGLKPALQAAQDAANVKVYQTLGAALDTVKEHFSGLAHQGLLMAGIFDNFANRVTADFAPGGAMGSNVDHLLANMNSDLVGIGQVFGNLGHLLISLAAQMPGLAELLLHSLAGILGFGVQIVDFIGHFHVLGLTLLTVIMAIEEFNRWGGALIGLLGRMGLATVALEGKFFTLARTASILRGVFSILPTILAGLGGWLATMGMQIPLIGTALTAAGEAMASFGQAALGAISALGTWGTLGVAVAAAALGFLIYKMVTAQSAVDKFTASLQQAADKATNLQVLGVLASNIAQLSARAQDFTTKSVGMRRAMTDAGDGANALRASMAQMGQQFVTVTNHALDLATTYHTSFLGALALADQAGVKLNQTLTKQQWAIAQIKIQSLVNGWKAMGAPVSAIGADMNALAIQSGLANTQVSKLNQAWDEFMSNITGGTTGLAAFEQSLTQLSTGTNKISTILGKGGSVTLSMKNFAQSLTSFTGKGAQAWQNFNQVIGQTAPQLIDWLRTAGAMGVLSGNQFKQAVLGMTAQLIPFAAKSATARSELMDLVHQAAPGIQTFGQLKDAVKNSGAGVKDLSKIVSEATQQMGNMEQVAQNLGTVMNSMVTNAMAAAALKTSGFYQAVGRLDSAIHTFGVNSPQAAKAAAQVASAQQRANNIAERGIKLTGQFEGAMKQAGNAASLERAQVDQLRAAIAQLHDKKISIEVDIAQHGGITLPGGGLNRITVPGMAKGSDGARRGMALVGEEGPELVYMRGGEHVVPAGPTGHLMKLAGHMSKVNAYAAGTGTHGNTKSLEQQLARELAVLAQKILGASSISGMSQLTSNLLSTIKQLASDHVIGKGEESRITHMIHSDNKRLDTLFKERQKILNKIHKADQYARNVSQAAQGTASLSTIMGSAGGGPVSSAFLLASMKIDLAGIRKFDSDIKKLERLGLDKALLNQIIQMGPVQGDQVAQALINGPLSNIKALNATESQVQKASKNLGRTTADRMFDSGKNAGKGFLTGLKSQEHEIEKLMRHLADTMVKTLRKELGMPAGGGHHRHHKSHGHVIGSALMDGLGAGMIERVPGLDTSLRHAAGHVTSALATAAGGGGRGGDIVIHNEIKVPVPGARDQFRTVQTQTLRVNRRNPQNHLSLVRGRGR